MNKNFKIKLFLFTFLCNSPLYSMELETNDSKFIHKNKLSKKQDKELQNNAGIEKLLRFHLKTQYSSVKNMIVKTEDLYEEIQNIKNSLLNQHIFLLSLNDTTDDLEGAKVNHLVGVQISKNLTNPEECTLDYLDLVENPASEEILSLFQKNFNKCVINKRLNFNNQVQFLGQTNDSQAVFLTYLFKHLKKTKFLKEKRLFSEIEDLSEFCKRLRNIFDLEKKIPDLACKPEPEEAKRLAVIFSSLSEEYTKIGDATKDISYYNEAALFYSYETQIIKNEDHLKINILYHKILECLTDETGKRLEKFVPETFDPYQLLSKLRESVKEKIKDIDNGKDTYIEDCRNLFCEITQKMEEFLGQLYQKAEEVIGRAPCDYAVIGLGSLALKQMTPYSDLEFAILISDQKDEDSSQKAKNYFKNLTQLVHFWVINLGESVIPPEKYNCVTRHLVRKAVNFDLGGKTPLGLEDKPYELICFVDEMLKYMRNKDQKTEHIDTTLPYILQKVSYVHGNKKLFDKYQEQTKEFLKTHGESRAVKMLMEGCCGIDYANNSRKEHKIAGNIEQFAFKLGTLSDGRVFNVKQEIYRLSDRLLYNLGLIYGIDTENSWDTIAQLSEKEIISKTAETNLKQALTFANLLRLKVYSYHGQHKDEMDWDEEDDLDQEREEVFKLSSEDLQEDGSLYKYYYVTDPLTCKLSEFCKLQKIAERFDKSIFFQEESFYDDSVLLKATIHQRLSKSTESIKYREQILPHIENSYSLAVGHFYYCLAHTYLQTRQHEKAIEFFEKTLKSDLPAEQVCFVFNMLGCSWREKGVCNKSNDSSLEYNRSYEYFQNSLNKQIENKLFIDENKPTELVIETFNGLGSASRSLGKFTDALEYIRKSLHMAARVFGENHYETASYYNEYGLTLMACKRREEALFYFEKSLILSKKFFNQNHYRIGATYLNIGCYYAEDEPNKALENFQNGLKILNKNLDAFYIDVMPTYYVIAKIYTDLKKYREALDYYTKALKIAEEKTLIPDIAPIHVHMADIYCKEDYEKRDYKKALIYYQKAIEVWEKNLYIYCGNVIMQAYHSVISLCKAYKEYDKGLDYCTRWTKIAKENLNLNFSLASSYNCTGEIYYEKKSYGKALSYYQKALNALRQESNKDNYYQDIVEIYNLMEEVFSRLGYQSKGNILRKSAEKIKEHEQHFYLLKWGKIDDKTANIMVAIASQLDGISQDVLKSSYSQIKKKITQACQKYKDKNDQEIAKMLCFEAICLGVAVREAHNKDPLICLKNFCKENIKLVNEIAKLHPEYFVSGDIVRTCIKDFPNELKSLEVLRQEPKAPIKELTNHIDKKREGLLDNESFYTTSLAPIIQHSKYTDSITNTNKHYKESSFLASSESHTRTTISTTSTTTTMPKYSSQPVLVSSAFIVPKEQNGSSGAATKSHSQSLSSTEKNDENRTDSLFRWPENEERYTEQGNKYMDVAIQHLEEGNLDLAQHLAREAETQYERAESLKFAKKF